MGAFFGTILGSVDKFITKILKRLKTAFKSILNEIVKNGQNLIKKICKLVA